MRLAIFGMSALVVAGALITGPAADARKKSKLPPARMAVAMLRTAQGNEVGRATVREVEGGLRFTVDARGVAPGTHGVHVHTVGRCDAPDFMTAGGHWNPTGAKHGMMNPAGPHQGDIPNLVIGKDGRGTVGAVVPGASFDGLLDQDGAAFVIHAAQDDLTTDPSGNSGARIACGTFSAG